MPRKLLTMSVEEFAEFQGLSFQRIYQLIDEGLPHRSISGKKRVVPGKASVWMRDRQRQDERPAEGVDKGKELAGKIKAERELKELELARLRGSLIASEVFQERVDSLCGGFAAVAAGQLQRFEREIVRAADAVSARRVTQAIQMALMKGAQEYADTLEAEMQAMDDASEVAA